MFSGEFSNALKINKLYCDCEVCMGFDWIVIDDTVVRPDCSVVCGEFKKDFLTFTAQLILGIFSHSARLRDRNTRFDLYEMYKVKYFIVADCDKKTTEIFELTGNKSRQTGSKNFSRTETCSINFNEFNLFV